MVGDTRDGRFFALRILNHPDNLRDGGVEANMRRAEPYGSREVDCPAENIVINGFVDGHALTGQQCFIGGCFAKCDHAIHWNQVAGTDKNHRVWHDAFDGDIDEFIAIYKRRCPRLAAKEIADRIPHVTLGARFEQTATKKKQNDGCSRFEVDIRAVDHMPHGGMSCKLRSERGGNQAPKRVGKRDRGTRCDKCIHVRGAAAGGADGSRDEWPAAPKDDGC